MPKALVITRPVSVEELEAVASREPQGRLRVRILAMRLVALGQSASQAAHALGQTTSRVCKWVHRFNAEGLDGLRERKRASRRPRLKPEHVARFKARVLAGAQNGDGVHILRAKDLRRILREEFGANCSLSGTYFILHRIGLSSLMPRSQHPETDPAVQEAFKKLSSEPARHCSETSRQTA
jgi:transposase